MENLDHETHDDPLEYPLSHGLWLTGRFLLQLLQSSKIALPMLVLALVAGLSQSLNGIFFQLYFWSRRSDSDFYLLEGDNLFRVFNLLTALIIAYLFIRGVLEGRKAWLLLKHSETDDDALLEGTERLGKMFRWLTLWGGVYIGTHIFIEFWAAILG
jgi:hypothetical protein